MTAKEKREIEASGDDTRANTVMLAEKYRLCQDRFCCWIEEKRMGKERKTGAEKEYWAKVAGYCPNYEQLFADFFNHKCMDTIQGKTAKAALKEMTKIARETEEMVRTLLREGGAKRER